MSSKRLSTTLWLLVVLALLGLAAASVALYEHVVYANGLAADPSFCSINAYIDCTKVNTSQWSKVFGLPIGAYGVFFYTVMLGLSLTAAFTRFVSKEDALAVSLLAALVASLSSLVLLGISHFLIGALCIICLGIYLVNFLLLGVTALGAWRGRTGVGLTHGFDSVLSFLGMTLLLMPGKGSGGAAAARVGFLLVAALAYGTLKLPGAMLESLSGGSIDATRMKLVQEAVQRWKEAPIDLPTVVDSPPNLADYREGSANAPISVVEFADFECGGCRNMYPVLHSVLEEFKGQYTFVFKNYPLDNDCNPYIPQRFHMFACTAALFARCAGEQGKLKEGIDMVFTSKLIEEPNGLSNPEVRDALSDAAASQFGLDAEALKECVRSQRYLTKIQDDIKEGRRLGLASTPSIWVNGRLVKGASPDVLRAVFKSVLAE
jgi:protein-disulfide isomerase/uncharacterized membrane protein